jgi:2-succinyl-6-hydroxy-2,4-cyclohexadiene-1-carboxylate synthase
LVDPQVNRPLRTWDLLFRVTVNGFIDSSGERIYYESWGDGDETVVLGHGMGGSHAVWYQQVAFLSSWYRVVTWDQRGFGRSTSASELGPGAAVDDMVALFEQLELDEAHVVGQSMGGWSALGFAIEHPEKTRSLVLADTIGGIFTPRIRQTLTEYEQLVAASPPPDRLPLGYHPAVGAQLHDENLAHSFLYGQLGSLTQPPPPTTIMPLLLATDHTDRAGDVAAPTLFIVGEHDPIFPPELIEEAAAAIEASHVAVVEDTGHSPYFERPGRWNGIVLEFLRHSTQ